jgi:hypothetical protein
MLLSMPFRFKTGNAYYEMNCISGIRQSNAYGIVEVLEVSQEGTFCWHTLTNRSKKELLTHVYPMTDQRIDGRLEDGRRVQNPKVTKPILGLPNRQVDPLKSLAKEPMLNIWA